MPIKSSPSNRKSAAVQDYYLEKTRAYRLSIQNIKRNKIYFVSHPTKTWVKVLVLSVDIKKGRCRVRDIEDDGELELEPKHIFFLPTNPVTTEDLTSLHHLHEPGIIDNLELRADLRNQRPYTQIANVLIAVNPLRQIPNPEKSAFLGDGIASVSPHPWNVAELAFRQMLFGLKSNTDRVRTTNQSIVISGESGAGKTETAKIVLEYLCTRVSSEFRMPDTPQRRSSIDKMVSTLDRQLLQSNPILESLGNAKTLRNDNSSRFGKFLKLQFKRENKSLMLSGATIETYLLERSRVVEQANGERNFHALYQLVSGSSAHDASSLLLPRRTEDFAYLSRVVVEEINDAERFVEVRTCVSSVGLGLSDEDVRALLNPSFENATSTARKERNKKTALYFEAITRCLATVLHIGNITFDAAETAASGDKACIISTTNGAAWPALNAAVETLGLDPPEQLEDLLIRRKIQAPDLGGNSDGYYTIEHDADTAALTRDAVAKQVYSELFECVVRDIGASMSAKEDPSSMEFIGVLDIFGFESFERNGLEQLLINFANESLQATFNRACLVAEQDLYKSEGIANTVEEVTVNDETSACLALIAGRTHNSIFFVLDDATRVGRNEISFCRELHTKLKNVPRWKPPHKKDEKDSFIVKHYAEPVQYKVGSFISKNANEIPEGLNELLANSYVFGTLLASMESSSPSSEFERTSSTASSLGALSKQKKKRTISAVFTSQMTKLCDLLDSTSCSFIRCIKPNARMSLGIFERDFVIRQLRAQGIPQTCEILKSAMPTRLLYSDIEARYRAVAEEALNTNGASSPLSGLDARAFTAAVLWALKIPETAFSFGKTRVFFRTGKITLLDRIYSVDLSSSDDQDVLKRLRFFKSRCKWRRALAKLLTLSMFVGIGLQSRAVTTIQIFYRYYRTFGKGKGRSKNRRLWRIAYIKVRCLKAFTEEFILIHETRLARERAEREAAAAVMEVKAPKRPASVILSEQMALGRISVDPGNMTLEMIREREQDHVQEQEIVELEEMDNEKFADNREATLSPTFMTGLAGVTGEQVDSLLTSAAALENVSLDVRKAIENLQRGKGAVRRWMHILVIRAFEKWCAVVEMLKKMPIESQEDLASTNDIEAKVEDKSVAEAWLRADLRRAVLALRLVISKVRDSDLNHQGIANVLDPKLVESLPQSDENLWNLLFRSAASKDGTDQIRLSPEGVKVVSETSDALAPDAQSDTAKEPEDVEAVTTLHQQIALLKKQLTAAGVQAVELVPLAEAREKMNAAVRRLMDGDMEAEKEVEKYDQIIRMHPDFEKEESEKAEKWARDTQPINLEAQREMRRLVPPDIRSASLKDLEAKGLPQSLVRRLWTKKATWLCRFHPDDIAKLHIADLLSKYNNQGLDIVEMRSCWASLPLEFENDGDGKKAQWKANFRTKLMELFTKEEQNRLSKNEKRNSGYKDADLENGYFDPEAPLIRAGVTKSNPYAAQEKPVVNVGAAASKAQFVKANGEKRKRPERPKISGMLTRHGKVASILPGKAKKMLDLSPAILKFIAVVDGEIRAYGKESDLKLQNAPEFALPIRGLKATVKMLEEPPTGFTVIDSANDSRLIIDAGNTKAAVTWRTVVKTELDYADQKEKMKRLMSLKKEADEKNTAERRPSGGRGRGLLGDIAMRRGRGGSGGRSSGGSSGSGSDILSQISARGRGRGIRGRPGSLAASIEGRGARGGGRSSLADAIARRGRRA